MTAQLTTTLKGRFQTGDVPQGSDYVDLFDSFLSLLNTTDQTIVSQLIVPTLGATDISAQSVETSALTVDSVLTINADTTSAVTDAASAKAYLKVTVSGTSYWLPLHS